MSADDAIGMQFLAAASHLDLQMQTSQVRAQPEKARVE
jgi:hypothetical protein